MEKILSLCARSGIISPEVIRLKGDLSERIIYRVFHKNGTFIAVYGESTAENEAFLSFRDSFESSGFKVPAFIAVSEDNRSYLLEDLGDMTVKKYCDEMNGKSDIGAVRKIYRRIMTELPRIQRIMYDKIDYSKCYQSQEFDKDNMKSDINRFEEFFLKKYHKEYDPAVFHKFEKKIISEADSQPKNYFLYRDFQTRNIMVKNGELYYIDFQSGRKGSFFYDIASFIYSSGTINYKGMEEELSEVYYNSLDPGISYDEFKNKLNIFACLRIMQALGNYAYYFYIRNDRSIEAKKENGLKMITNLSRSINMETGIYEG